MIHDMTRLFILLGLILGPCVQRAAAEAVSLKELQGENFIEVKHDAKQDVTIAGHPTQTTNTRITFVFKLSPVKSDDAGTLYDVTILKCDDTSQQVGQAETSGTFKGFNGKKFQILVAPRQQKVEFRDTDHLVPEVFGADAIKADEGQKKFFGDLMRGILQVHLGDAFVPLPEKAVGQGDTWRHTATMTIQPFAEMSMDREYKLQGQEKKDGQDVHVIHWASKMEIKPLKDDKGVLPFKVVDMKTNGESDDHGSIYWDAAANRPAKIEVHQKYSMDMTMEIGQQTMKGTGAGTDSFDVRYLAADPTK
jgi:hypothetical protein